MPEYLAPGVYVEEATMTQDDIDEGLLVCLAADQLVLGIAFGLVAVTNGILVRRAR